MRKDKAGFASLRRTQVKTVHGSLLVEVDGFPISLTQQEVVETVSIATSRGAQRIGQVAKTVAVHIAISSHSHTKTLAAVTLSEQLSVRAQSGLGAKEDLDAPGGRAHTT